MADRSVNPVLAYSGRISSSRYFNTVFVTRPDIVHKVVSDLRSRPPAVIVRLESNTDVPAAIDLFVQQHYRPILSKRGYLVFAPQ
jgi:hypothetical protein